ncbi:TetR/AcrR family transcriptional regulator [Methylobacterium crusticola]|uniref:TetR/AcrR family transcriptional regulator n=1 Tax=Methylobacterium crusticola TaxID=1697972 RepID=UPI001396BF2B|nr:TetR/AcrR family transcriptional regulator [Methylobacterium crusticola]
MTGTQGNAALRAARDEREAALRDTRRRLVLEGAWRVFARVGLDGATMRAIAAASGCTTGALYPLFPSKEAIYAALLAESLARLETAVTEAARAQAQPDAALRAGAFAFLDYYRARPDEVALGLYLWNGVRPRGLSRELDAELNARLMASLGVLEASLRDMGVDKAGSARAETAALFAFLIGALVVHQAGRLRMLGCDLDEIAQAHVDALVERLSTKPRGERSPA